jgi:hypothetical protein
VPDACLLPQIIPLLTELRAGNLVGNVEALTQVRAGELRTAADLDWCSRHRSAHAHTRA